MKSIKSYRLLSLKGGYVFNKGTQSSIYIQSLQEIGFERIADFSKKKGYKLPLVAKEPYETSDSARRYKETNGWFVLCGTDVYPYYKKLELINSEFNLGLTITHS